MMKSENMISGSNYPGTKRTKGQNAKIRKHANYDYRVITSERIGKQIFIIINYIK